MKIFKKRIQGGRNLAVAYLAVAYLITAAAFLASPLPAVASSASGTSSLAPSPILESALARYLLQSTREGKTFARGVLGRAIYDQSDLRRLSKRLSRGDRETKALRSDFETRLHRIEAELKTRRAGVPQLGTRSELLESLAAQHLKTISGSNGRIQFAGPPSGARNITQAREAFIQSASEAAEQARAVKISSADAATRESARAFENAIPIVPGSIEAGLRTQSKIYGRLKLLEEKYLYEGALYDGDRIAEFLSHQPALRGKPVTLHNVIAYVVIRRKELASELITLADFYGHESPLLANLLRHAAGKIGMSESATRRFAEKMPELSAKIYEPGGKHYHDVASYAAVIWGELGELRVAVREAGLSERGLDVSQLGRVFGKGPMASEARAELRKLVSERPTFFAKELDLIFDQGRIWGEVKYFREPFSHRHNQWSSLIDQAEKTLDLKRALEANGVLRESLGGGIDLRIYFVNGVTPEAAAHLERMGFAVFGARF